MDDTMCEVDGLVLFFSSPCSSCFCKYVVMFFEAMKSASMKFVE